MRYKAYLRRAAEEGCFTVGNVYDVKNGKITDDNGLIFNTWSDPELGRDDSFGSLYKWFYETRNRYEFELVVEEPEIKIGKISAEEFINAIR